MDILQITIWFIRGKQTKKEIIPYPICSVVAVFKMLVRILNTLRSRIWDMVFFLFSDCSKSTVGKNGNSPLPVLSIPSQKSSNKFHELPTNRTQVCFRQFAKSLLKKLIKTDTIVIKNRCLSMKNNVFCNKIR